MSTTLAGREPQTSFIGGSSCSTGYGAVGRMRIEVPSRDRKGEREQKLLFNLLFFLNLRRTKFLPQTLAKEKERGEK